MLASRSGLGHKAVQDHFLEVLVLVLEHLVLVLVLNSGLSLGILVMMTTTQVEVTVYCLHYIKMNRLHYLNVNVHDL